MNDIIRQFMQIVPVGTEIMLLKMTVALVISIVLYTLGARFVMHLVTSAVTHSHNRQEMHHKDLKKRLDTLRSVVSNLWRLLVVLGLIVYITSLFVSDKIIVSAFTSAGFIGVALAFGAQSLVKDFLSGLFIISENQYRVGDVIEIDGFSGTVERIGSRTTKLRDIEGNVHFFPNGSIIHVANKTMGYSKARLVLSLHPDTEIEDAAKVINKVGKKLAREKKWKDKIIDAPKYIMTQGISATGTDVIISGKVQPADQWSVTSEMRVRLLDALEDAGIELSVGSNTNTVVNSQINIPQSSKTSESSGQTASKTASQD